MVRTRGGNFHSRAFDAVVSSSAGSPPIVHEEAGLQLLHIPEADHRVEDKLTEVIRVNYNN